MIKTIAFLSSDGGCGKSANAHLLCLGAIWNGIEAAFLHSDDKEPLIVNRPYHYFDCRTSKKIDDKVSEIMHSGEDGIVIIDGGAGRKGLDKWLAERVDLIVIPVDLTRNGVLEAIKTSEMVSQNGGKFAFIIPSRASEDSLSLDDKTYVDKVAKHGDIAAYVRQVRAIRKLDDDDIDGKFKTPPTAVNKASKDLYSKLSLYW